MGESLTAGKLYHEANTLKWSTNPEELGLFSILGVQYATYLLAMGRITESYENTKHNLEICNSRGWKESIAFCERLLGDILYTQNNINLASEHYNKAFEIAQNFGIQEEVSRNLLGLAKIAIVNLRFDEAISNLKTALELADQSNHNLVVIDVYNCWAELSLAQMNIIEAKRRLQTSLEFANIAQYSWGEGAALHLRGQAALFLEEYAEAEFYLEKAVMVRTLNLDPKLQQTKELLIKAKLK